ncbi:MAG: glycosyltransferase family 4 protein [Patescibacteria group bacterium]
MSILAKIKHLLYGPEITIFHEFQKPPYGGGNQFLIALEKELKRRREDVGRNKIGKNTKAVLFNSFNFNFDQLKSAAGKFHPKMVHRVDGPISAYRGESAEIDRKIWAWNHELADKTVFQSHYSLDKHIELGLNFKSPSVIPNASDSEIFNRAGRIPPPDGKRKIKLIAASWSDNSRKGGPFLEWLDENLDRDIYELTFVGRTKASFHGAKVIGAVPPEKLAEILKEHDIYIAPSENDPCSNALLEALSCGLPAAYLKSGGHSELVKDAGVGFSGKEEMLTAVNKVAGDYESYQSKIKTLSLSEVADKYLEILK